MGSAGFLFKSIAPTRRPPDYRDICIHLRYDKCVKRDVYKSKKTYMNPKQTDKRDLLRIKACVSNRRCNKFVKRDLQKSKETCKRDLMNTKDTFDVPERVRRSLI